MLFSKIKRSATSFYVYLTHTPMLTPHVLRNYQHHPVPERSLTLTSTLPGLSALPQYIKEREAISNAFTSFDQGFVLRDWGLTKSDGNTSYGVILETSSTSPFCPVTPGRTC